MKLVINIPCYNEEKTLPLVLKEIPKRIDGIKTIEVQIVDDGSSDKTVEVAEKHNVTRIIKHKANMGLGIAFKNGVEAALDANADIMVNTDADNQYPSNYIKDLVEPIVACNADIVIGNRNPWKVRHFSIAKRIFQFFGNLLVRKIIGIYVPDTVSGFRAYSKDSLLRLNIVTKFSYVLDTIMQAVIKNLKIVNVPIDINPPTRKSRLFKNIFQHMQKSLFNVVRLFYIYKPFNSFLILSLLVFIPGFALICRFGYFYLTGDGSGHVQSLIVAAIFEIASLLVFGFAILGDTIKVTRQIAEDDLYLKKKYLFSFEEPEDRIRNVFMLKNLEQVPDCIRARSKTPSCFWSRS